MEPEYDVWVSYSRADVDWPTLGWRFLEKIVQLPLSADLRRFLAAGPAIATASKRLL